MSINMRTKGINADPCSDSFRSLVKERAKLSSFLYCLSESVFEGKPWNEDGEGSK